MSFTSGGPEYIDSAQPPMAGAGGGGGEKRTRLIALGAVVGVGAVIGGAAWAATSFFSTGAQAAEALPDSTLAYVSLDFNPSGAQKVEAIRMLRKFPAIQDELNLKEDDDLGQKFFDETLKEECDGVDYAKDVEPWLGSRAGMALVPDGDEPKPVFVLQVKDGGKAEAGIETLVEKCGGSSDEGESSEEGESDDDGGFVVTDDWIIAGPGQDFVDGVVKDAEKASLADDAAFGKWTDAAGDDGIMTTYVAKGITEYAGEFLGDSMGLFGPSTVDLGYQGDFSELDQATEGEELPEGMQKMLDEFEGAAFKLRFDDAGLEFEAASSFGSENAGLIGDAVASELTQSLPSDAVAAFAMSFGEGWFDKVMERVEEASDGEMTKDELYAEAEEATGLSLPEDIDTLLGEGIAVALGSDIDPEAISNGGPEELPLAVKLKGDPEAIEEVLDKVRMTLMEEGAASEEEIETLLASSAGDDVVVLGPNADFREDVAKGGDLGDDDTFGDIVEADDAVSLLYVNFNAADDWLVQLVDGDEEAEANLKPLKAFGVSAWLDGDDVGHVMLKLTTD